MSYKTFNFFSLQKIFNYNFDKFKSSHFLRLKLKITSYHPKISCQMNVRLSKQKRIPHLRTKFISRWFLLLFLLFFHSFHPAIYFYLESRLHIARFRDVYIYSFWIHIWAHSRYNGDAVGLWRFPN